jgi:histidinol-phosphate aminotransferase
VTARLRPELHGLPVYVPGKNVPGSIKLASNETVFGPLPSVHAAIERAVGVVNRYPDNGCVDLKAALAMHLGSGFAPEHVAVGSGSVTLCQQLVQITTSAGDEVMMGWRSFECYLPIVQVAGATAVKVPLTDHTHDLDAMLAAITDRTRLVFVCNPNNPTSTVVDPDALARFVEAMPPHILIAVDEAYVEYIRDGMLPKSLELSRRHSNVVVLRTFSKAYGLAGLRVGYAVGHPDVITALDKVVMPFAVTNVAQAAAIASLDAADELMARTDALVLERTRVSAGLRDAGFALPPSQANFVWLPLGSRTTDFVEQAADAHLVVRPFASEGVRVTIGAPQENDALLQFARDWIARTEP